MANTTTKNILLSQPKAGSSGEVPQAVLPHEVVKSEAHTILKVEIPGVDPSTVDVNYEHGALRVSCVKGVVNHHLDPLTDTSKIEADILWGLLTIKVPNPEIPAARSIRVNIADTVRKAATKSSHKEFASSEEA